MYTGSHLQKVKSMHRKLLIVCGMLQVFFSTEANERIFLHSKDLNMLIVCGMLQVFLSTEANERISLHCHSKNLNMFTDCSVYSRIGSVIHRLCVKPGLVPLGLRQRTRLLSVKQFYRIGCVYL